MKKNSDFIAKKLYSISREIKKTSDNSKKQTAENIGIG